MTNQTTGAYRFAILLGMVVALIMGSLYVRDFARLLGDPDTLWHVKLGSDMIASHHLPVVDSYSYTYGGSPFISKEWLSEIVFALVHQYGGWNGVMLLTALASVTAVLVLYRELARYILPSFAGLAAILLSLMLNPVILARPHLLTLAIAAIICARLFRAAEHQEPPPFWLLMLVCLWANLHGSFTLAFVTAGFAFLHLFENSRFNNPSLLAKWIIFLVLCPVVALIHPYFFEPTRIGLQMMATNKAMAYIMEWMPLNAQDDALIEYFILAVLAFLLGARLQLGWAKSLFIVFVLHMLLTHVRFVYVFFLLVPIVVVPEIAKRFPEISTAMWLNRPRDVLEQLGAKWFVPAASVLVLVGTGLASWYLSTHKAMPPEDSLAEKPISFALANHLDGHVFNEYRYGGTLIFHGIKTFIDGRAEQLFLGNFFPDYIASGKHDGEKMFKDIIDKNQVTWTLLPVDDLRNGFLDHLGWKKAYADDKAVIYSKPAS